VSNRRCWSKRVGIIFVTWVGGNLPSFPPSSLLPPFLPLFQVISSVKGLDAGRRARDGRYFLIIIIIIISTRGRYI